MRAHFFICCIITVLLYPAVPRAQQALRGTAWDRPEIYRPPAYRTEQGDSALAIVYRGLPYKGRQQEVFAWYATPGTLSGNRSYDRQLPGIVLVHGGGGAAFREWAIMWAKRGYAAIAMDLRGNDAKRGHLPLGFEEPGGETPYFDVTAAPGDQWMFQAVANVLLAHQLLRSFPEVDTARTAVTGISWGGVITCTVAGLDERFRAAVPVYGCGYLWESGRMKAQLDQLPPQQRETWIRQYDPSNYIAKAAMPLLFVNGTNDPYFELDSYARTYRLVRKRQLCIKAGMAHGHKSGWASAEIACFVNSVLNDTLPLPAIGQPLRRGRSYRAGIASRTRIVKAALFFTQDSVPLTRKWQRRDITVTRRRLVFAAPPPGTTAWYLAVEDKRGMYASGELQFVTPPPAPGTTLQSR